MLSPEEQLPRLVIQHAIVQTYELPDDQREELDRAFEISKQNAALAAALVNVQLRSQIMQAQAGPGAGLPGAGSNPPAEQQITEGVPDRETMSEGTPQDTTFEEVQPSKEAVA
jgi:hypothetical protein